MDEPTDETPLFRAASFRMICRWEGVEWAPAGRSRVENGWPQVDAFSRNPRLAANFDTGAAGFEPATSRV